MDTKIKTRGKEKGLIQLMLWSQFHWQEHPGHQEIVTWLIWPYLAR
jgi:hypothetical protein